MSVFTEPLKTKPVDCSCGGQHIGKSHFNETMAEQHGKALAQACEAQRVHFGSRPPISLAEFSALYRENWL